MATLAVDNTSVLGVEPTLVTAAGGGDDFPNEGVQTIFVIDNASGGAITVTFDDTGSVSPVGAEAFDADVAVILGAGTRFYIGPFPLNRFGKSVAVTYSGVTSLTVGVIRVVSRADRRDDGREQNQGTHLRQGIGVAGQPEELAQAP
jgi:hypothetical protein